MPDFDSDTFQEVTVLPPERVRHHLLRFEGGLTQALRHGLQCDRFKAANLVTQAQLFGFSGLARSLAAAFAGGNGNPDAALRSAELAIAEARPKITELLNSGYAPWTTSSSDGLARS